MTTRCAYYERKKCWRSPGAVGFARTSGSLSQCKSCTLVDRRVLGTLLCFFLLSASNTHEQPASMVDKRAGPASGNRLRAQLGVGGAGGQKGDYQ